MTMSTFERVIAIKRLADAPVPAMNNKPMKYSIMETTEKY